MRITLAAAAAAGLIVGAAAGAGATVLFAQPEEQPCQATLTGRVVSVDLDTCISSTTTTTSTTVPATTTTEEPTTTSSSTTSPPTSTTSTTLSPTTSSPIPGVAFSERFEDPGSFDARFVYDVGNYVDWQHHRTDYLIDCCPWVETNLVTYGDHNDMCSGPDQQRTLDNADPDLRKYFWYCAPGGPTTGHVMTAFDTTGYNVVSFSPNQTFTDVSHVCWDINATEEGGGKWTNMIIVPEALYQQFAPRMDYVTSGFNADDGPGDFNIQAQDHPGKTFFGVRDFRGTQTLYEGPNEIAKPTGEVSNTTTDKATRYTHCLDKDGTTARLSVERPTGGTSVYNVNVGSAWPTGPVRVIFQDEMYDPPKRAGYNDHNVTWHWDNIEIG